MSADSHEDNDIRLFREEYPDIYEFVLKVINRTCDNKDIEKIKADYGEDFYDGVMKIIYGKADTEDIRRFKEDCGKDFYNVFKKVIERKIEQSSISYEAKPDTTGYKKGDFIGQKYEVYDVLGMGGFGIVYLVYSHETKSAYALKTFRDEYLEDKQTRDRFRKEAQVWIDLERHPYLVRAYFVDEISGRLFIAMEFIAPEEEGGLNSLDACLKHRPPDLAQSLRWAIQFCYGMEYAYSKGIRAHRDIKPANIMIGQDKAVKISDFGLAGVIGTSKAFSGIRLDIQNGRVGFSCQTMEGVGFGTPTHMPPEQFVNAACCDERSDIYSFGIVLYQMASGGNLPFLAPLPQNDSYEESRRFWIEMYKLHSKASIPKLSSTLFPVIQRCLGKEPRKRYSSFKELRIDLEPVLKQQSGEVIKLPEQKELEAWEWNNRGTSLDNLCRYNEAVYCYDKALEINSNFVEVWNNKGNSLANLGKYEKAIGCYDKALEINPRFAEAWDDKGIALSNLDKAQEAIFCYDRALEINSKLAEAWYNKGLALRKLGKYEEAIDCYEKTLEINSKFAEAWTGKGVALMNLGRHHDAIICYDRALKMNPMDEKLWINKGIALRSLGKYQEAIASCNRALEINPKFADAWDEKGISLKNLGKYEEAIASYDQVLEINPKLANAWHNRGNALMNLVKYEEAIDCYEKVLEINSKFAEAWTGKGVALMNLGRHHDAIICYNRALEINPMDVKVLHFKGLVLIYLDKAQEAIACYDKALSIDPTRVAIWNSKGNVLLWKLDKASDAIFCFDRTLEIDPRHAGAWFNKGSCLKALGKYRESIEAFKNYIRFAPPQDLGHVEKMKKVIQQLEAQLG